MAGAPTRPHAPTHPASPSSHAAASPGLGAATGASATGLHACHPSSAHSATSADPEKHFSIARLHFA